MDDHSALTEDRIGSRLAALGIEPDGPHDPIHDDPTFRSLVSKVDAVIDEHRVHLGVAERAPAEDPDGFASLRADLTAREGAIATERGVLRPAPRFDQARGFDADAESALLAAGFRDPQAVLGAPVDEIARITGLDQRAIAAARADLDLGRVDGVDAETADLLRAVDVHSVSRLAGRDPVRLALDVDRIVAEHAVSARPAALADVDAVARLVDAANLARL